MIDHTNVLAGMELDKCPFCGAEAAEFISNGEMVDMMLEGADMELTRLEDYSGWYVICDATKGGCGACSGAGQNKAHAARKWNRRGEPESI